MTNMSIKFKHNGAYDFRGDNYLSFFHFLAFWFPWQPITRVPQVGQYMPVHHFITWKKVLIGIFNSPFKWRDNREKVDKIHSFLTIL